MSTGRGLSVEKPAGGQGQLGGGYGGGMNPLPEIDFHRLVNYLCDRRSATNVAYAVGMPLTSLANYRYKPGRNPPYETVRKVYNESLRRGWLDGYSQVGETDTTSPQAVRRAEGGRRSVQGTAT